eukprot:16157915-Heterocapsa_arctica.AAC.1
MTRSCAPGRARRSLGGRMPSRPTVKVASQVSGRVSSTRMTSTECLPVRTARGGRRWLRVPGAGPVGPPASRWRCPANAAHPGARCGDCPGRSRAR